MTRTPYCLLWLSPLIWLAGCAQQNVYVARTSPDPARIESRSVSPAPNRDHGVLVTELALDLLGTPYRYGGANPNEGFDCSGLVFYTFTQSGVSIPRTSQAQFKAARKISIAQADPGDLVFFQDQAKLSHVGIYLGNGRFVHAPASGRTVSVASLTAPYCQRHLVAVGRLLPE
jgi:cell wall-associated NlpC family hydrolase